MRYFCAVFMVWMIAGCSTHITPAATGGSRADGIVEMSYQYGAMTVPTVDKAGALANAIKRCQRWGYTGAEPFDAGLSTCIQPGGFGGCNAWRVTTEYQCLHNTGAPVQSSGKYGAQVQEVAGSMECTQGATMTESTAESERWTLDCGDGESLQVRCFDDACYVK